MTQYLDSNDPRVVALCKDALQLLGEASEARFGDPLARAVTQFIEAWFTPDDDTTEIIRFDLAPVNDSYGRFDRAPVDNDTSGVTFDDEEYSGCFGSILDNI